MSSFVPRIYPPVGWGALGLLRLSRSSLIQQIQTHLQSLTGCKYILLFPYGRSALSLVLKKLCQPGDIVALPAFTCSSVPQAVITAGLVPLFVDIDPNTGLMDIGHLEKLHTQFSISAVIPTALFGLRIDVDEIKKLNIPNIVVDAALALDTHIGSGSSVCAQGDASILSFSTGKHITFIKGGALATNDPDLYQRCRTSLEAQSVPWSLSQSLKNAVFFLGVMATRIPLVYKFADYLFRSGHLDFLMAGAGAQKVYFPLDAYRPLDRLSLAVGLWGLNKFDSLRKHRLQLQKIYQRHLSHLSLAKDINATDALSHYPIRVAHRDEFVSEARMQNYYLAGGLFEYAVSELKWPRSANESKNCLEAKKLAAEIVNLPLSMQLSVEDVETMAIWIKQYGHEAKQNLIPAPVTS